MAVQSVGTSIPQVGGNLQKFRSQVKVQTQKQVQSVKVEIKRLINYKG